MGGGHSSGLGDAVQRRWKLLRHGRQLIRIFMTGLDSAGKTTMIYQLGGEVTTTIPTPGFNVESVAIQNSLNDISITTWDEPLRTYRSLYCASIYHGFDAVIFVVDSSDLERIDNDDNDSAKQVLQKLLSDDELRDAPLLILANKQELPSAISAEEVTMLLYIISTYACAVRLPDRFKIDCLRTVVSNLGT